MKPVSYAIAALFTGAATLAIAQTEPPRKVEAAQSSTNLAPTYSTPDTFVQEPTASASKSDGPDGELAKAIVDAMNADQSLKNSKITVQPEEGRKITLTGTTMTKAQAKRAAEIATAQVGEGNVVNAIRDAEV